MILVDSSVWIDYFNGKPTKQSNLLDLLLTREDILVGDLILVEVLQGFKHEKDFNAAKKLFNDLINVDLGGNMVAQLSLSNYRILRQKGVTVRKTIDIIIGSYCIYNEIPLLHSDKDFDAMVKHCRLKVL